jgi:threonine/homoserine/homoserine lactone efflux protein
MMLDVLAAMPPGSLAAFVAGGLILNLTPGADVLFATACGIAGGPRAGAMAGLGVGAGALVHAGLAAAGVAALVAAHPAALDALRWIGAAWLLWLAAAAWRRAGAAERAAGAAPAGAGRAFRRGALTNLLNPKPLLFVMAFLPQFVDPARGPVWAQVMALGTLFAMTGALVTAGYGALAGHAGRVLRARAGLLDRAAAVILAGLAARLALD